jgi:hypothetical protein
VRHPVANALGPRLECRPRPLDVLSNRLRPLDDAEVDEREPRRLVEEDLVERPVPSVEIDVRRRRVGDDEPAGHDADAGRITGVERAVFAHVRGVVRRVTGGRERLQPRRVLLDHDHVLRRNGEWGAVGGIEDLAVEAARRLDEPRRVDEMWCADRVHVHLDLRVVAHDVTRCARVVEMDVREEQMPDLGQVDAAAQLLVARGWATVEQRRPMRRLEHVDADHALDVEVLQVDRCNSHRRVLPAGPTGTRR